MEPSSPELSPQEQRIRYYQNRAERLLRRYGTDFTHFIHEHDLLLDSGEDKLKTYETTGYNILLDAKDMKMASKKPLIFYGNYVARTRHFGLLLATMEQESVITQDRVRFGVRGAKVLWNPAWGDVPTELAQTGTIHRITPGGGISEHATLQSVEIVVTFSPKSKDQAIDIAHF